MSQRDVNSGEDEGMNSGPALFVFLSVAGGFWCLLHFGTTIYVDGSSSMHRTAIEALISSVLAYPFMIALPFCRGRKAKMTIGEIFGLSLGLFFALTLCTSWLWPDESITLLLFMIGLPVYAVMVAVEFGLLLRILFGMPRQIPSRLTDWLGNGIVIAFGVTAILEIYHHPPAF